MLAKKVARDQAAALAKAESAEMLAAKIAHAGGQVGEDPSIGKAGVHQQAHRGQGLPAAAGRPRTTIRTNYGSVRHDIFMSEIVAVVHSHWWQHPYSDILRVSQT